MPSSPSQPPAFEAVLFDLDGTLVHTHIDFSRMKEAVLELVAGAGLDPEVYRARDVLSILTAVTAHLPDSDELLARAEEALVAIELAACEGATEATGAGETLRWLLAQGVRVGIVTRNSRQAAAEVMRSFSLPHEVLLTRADTPRVKPDPLHLQLALRQLNVAPHRALMVGDHVMDVEGGKAAGMRTVGILTPERAPDFFERVAPDGVIHQLPELRAWIYPSSS